MADVTIRISKSGPYVVTGAVRLEDHTGVAYELKPERPVALCRCGRSARRPFCDGSHASCGFVSEEAAR